MENYLFSKKNIDNQCLQLLKATKMQQNPNTVKACRGMLTQQIKQLYDMSINNKKVKTMKPQDYVNRLCKTAIRNCSMKIGKTQQQRTGKTGEFQGLTEDVSGGYAPIQMGDGGYITATGELGDRMPLKGERSPGILQNKPPPEDLEEAMYNRMVGYDQRGGNSGGFGNQRGPPQAIDFSLDNDSVRRNTNDPRQGGMQQQGNQQDTSQFFSGFEGFDGGGGQMDSGMGGLNDIGMLGVQQPGNSYGQQDTNAAFNRIQNERTNQDTQISSRQRPSNFNPMNSPNGNGQFNNFQQQQQQRGNHNSRRQQPIQQPMQQYNPMQQQMQYQNPQYNQMQQPMQQPQYNPMQYQNPQYNQMQQRQMQQPMQQQMHQQMQQPQYNQMQPQMPQYNQPGNFFPIVPSEREGHRQNPYEEIANEIIKTGNYEIIKTLHASDVDGVVSILKKYQESMNNSADVEEEEPPKEKRTEKRVVHDVAIKKEKKTDKKPQSDRQTKQLLTPKPAAKPISKTISKPVSKPTSKTITKPIIEKVEKETEKKTIGKSKKIQVIETESEKSDEESEEVPEAQPEKEIVERSDDTSEVEDEPEEPLVEENEKESSNLLYINGEEYDLNEYVEPEFYNNFMITLKKPIKNVSVIEVLKADISMQENNINACNNTLKITNESGEHNMSVVPGKYDVEQLIQSLNATFSKNNVDIVFSYGSDKHITIKSSKEFTIENDKTSLLHVLGFEDKSYSEMSEYVSDNKNMLGENLNPTIELIYNGDKNTKHVFDLPIEKKIRKKLDKNIDMVENIIFKFKQTAGCQYDLNGIAPSINILFCN